jgi:hypothetical protein
MFAIWCRAPATPPGTEGIFIFYFILFYFFLVPNAEMRQKHAPEFHASQKPRSRARTAKNGPKQQFALCAQGATSGKLLLKRGFRPGGLPGGPAGRRRRL